MDVRCVGVYIITVIALLAVGSMAFLQSRKEPFREDDDEQNRAEASPQMVHEKHLGVNPYLTPAAMGPGQSGVADAGWRQYNTDLHVRDARFSTTNTKAGLPGIGRAGNDMRISLRKAAAAHLVSSQNALDADGNAAYTAVRVPAHPYRVQHDGDRNRSMNNSMSGGDKELHLSTRGKLRIRVGDRRAYTFDTVERKFCIDDVCVDEAQWAQIKGLLDGNIKNLKTKNFTTEEHSVTSSLRADVTKANRVQLKDWSLRHEGGGLRMGNIQLRPCADADFHNSEMCLGRRFPRKCLDASTMQILNGNQKFTLHAPNKPQNQLRESTPFVMGPLGEHPRQRTYTFFPLRMGSGAGKTFHFDNAL